MLRTTLFSIAMILLPWNVFSQETEEKFKPYGQGIIKIFTNYHSTFSDGKANFRFFCWMVAKSDDFLYYGPQSL